jgi:hypothetical protein
LPTRQDDERQAPKRTAASEVFCGGCRRQQPGPLHRLEPHGARLFAAAACRQALGHLFVGDTVPYTLGSVFVDATSPRTTLVVSGIAVFGVAALAWPVLRRASP